MSSTKYVEIARKVREWAKRPELTERQRALAEAAAELALSIKESATSPEPLPEEFDDLRVYGCYLCKYVGARDCLCPSQEGTCTINWRDFHSEENPPG